MNLISVLAFRRAALSVERLTGGRSMLMRLLGGFLVVVFGLLALQSVHPECSMTAMLGVEWVQCLAR
jgi:hypothetical protein